MDAEAHHLVLPHRAEVFDHEGGAGAVGCGRGVDLLVGSGAWSGTVFDGGAAVGGQEVVAAVRQLHRKVGRLLPLDVQTATPRQRQQHAAARQGRQSRPGSEARQPLGLQHRGVAAGRLQGHGAQPEAQGIAPVCGRRYVENSPSGRLGTQATAKQQA